jgi:hypothetical protein
MDLLLLLVSTHPDAQVFSRIAYQVNYLLSNPSLEICSWEGQTKTKGQMVTGRGAAKKELENIGHPQKETTSSPSSIRAHWDVEHIPTSEFYREPRKL